jgi:hypothetical protein
VLAEIILLCLVQGSAPEQQEKCKKASNFCYALWKEEANGTSILGQGEYNTDLCTLWLAGLCLRLCMTAVQGFGTKSVASNMKFSIICAVSVFRK